MLETLNEYKELAGAISGILFVLFGFYYAMRKTQLELLLAGETQRKMHDTGMLVCVFLFCGILNLSYGFTDGVRFEGAMFSILFTAVVILVIGYLISCIPPIRNRLGKDISVAVDVVFVMLVLAIFSLILSWIDFAGNVSLYLKQNGINDEAFVKLLEEVGTIGIFKRINYTRALWICALITFVESAIITVELLTVSLSESHIQLTMYDADGNITKDHVFVYSRLGKRLIVGDSPRMTTSYKHIYSIKIDDVYSNDKNAFNYYFESDEDKKKRKKARKKKKDAKKLAESHFKWIKLPFKVAFISKEKSNEINTQEEQQEETVDNVNK